MATTTATTAADAAKASEIAAKYDNLLTALERLANAQTAESAKRTAAAEKLVADVTTANFDMQRVPDRFKAWQVEDKQLEDRLDAFAKTLEKLTEYKGKLETDHGAEVVEILKVRKQALADRVAREQGATQELTKKIEEIDELIKHIEGKGRRGRTASAG